MTTKSEQIKSILKRLNYISTFVDVSDREREFATSGTYNPRFLELREQYREERASLLASLASLSEG